MYMLTMNLIMFISHNKTDQVHADNELSDHVYADNESYHVHTDNETDQVHADNELSDHVQIEVCDCMCIC